MAQFDPLEQVAYRESLKHYWDLNNVVDTAREEGWEEGRAKGWEDGLAAGEARGREEGLAAGEARGRAATIAQIRQSLEATGLSQADIDRAIANLDP